jgi:hypothetical protein
MPCNQYDRNIQTKHDMIPTNDKYRTMPDRHRTVHTTDRYHAISDPYIQPYQLHDDKLINDTIIFNLLALPLSNWS